MFERFDYRSLIWDFELDDDDAILDVARSDADDVEEAIHDVASWAGALFAHCCDDPMGVVVERGDIVREIVATGYAMDNAKYLGIGPEGTMADYVRYLAGATERYRIERIYLENVFQVIESVALCRLAELYGDYLDTAAYKSVELALSDFGKYSELDEIREAAARVYAAALR